MVLGELPACFRAGRLPLRGSDAATREAAYSLLHLLPEAEQKQAYDRFVFDSGRATFEIGYWLLDRRDAARVDASKVTCPAGVNSA